MQLYAYDTHFISSNSFFKLDFDFFLLNINLDINMILSIAYM